MTPLSYKLLTLAAGETRPSLAYTGNKFFCQTATFPFQVRFDQGEQIPIQANIRINTGPFTSVTLINPDLSRELTVGIWVGNAEVDFLPSPLTTLAPTQLRAGLGQFPLETTEEWVSPGIVNGRRRKQFVVTNLSATNDLTINVTSYGSGRAGSSLGRRFNTVFPRSQFTLETDADYILRNDSGQEIMVVVGETEYL